MDLGGRYECVCFDDFLASHIGKEPEMPIWPMPKEYKRGDTTVVVDPYNFHFVPNKNHPDILAAMDRYMDLMFSSNRARLVEGKAITEARIQVEDYDVMLNV